MLPFIYQNPTKLIFGKGQISQLTPSLEAFGKKVLVVYGGGSIKKSGLYDSVMSQLQAGGFEIFELGGVEPNPRLTTAIKGAEICKQEGIDVILAVGGGSVLDCTKLISVGAKYDGNPWDIVTRKHFPREAVPFGAILTLAATGSEMNSGSVITNEETEEKFGWGSPITYPKFSILDPEYTFSVPKNHTVYGMVDIMSHVFEQYFHTTKNTVIIDRYCESILKTVVETAPVLVEDLHNYDARETILYCGTLALNRQLSVGVNGDWSSHNIEHAVSALYDIPHGAGLAILTPHWMKHVYKENPARFAQFASRVFEVETNGKTDEEVALEGIEKLRAFWDSIGAPARLADFNIDDTRLDELVSHAMLDGEFGSFKKLNAEDVRQILLASM